MHAITPINQPINKSINQSINKPIEKNLSQIIEQSRVHWDHFENQSPNMETRDCKLSNDI